MRRRRRLSVAAAALILAAAALATLRWIIEPEPLRKAVRLTTVGDVRGFLWSRAGPRLMLVCRQDRPGDPRRVVDYDRGALQVLPAATPAERTALIGEFGAAHPDQVRPHVGPDGERVVVGMPDSLAVEERATRRRTELLRGGTNPGRSVAARYFYDVCWSPGGRQIACLVVEQPRHWTEVLGVQRPGSGRRTVRVLLAVDTATGHARRVAFLGPVDTRDRSGPAHNWLQWSPDGRRIGFLRGGDVWAVEAPR